ncbi:ParB/RepB/Spo0J family partition protein [Planctomycetota bacterium]
MGKEKSDKNDGKSDDFNELPPKFVPKKPELREIPIEKIRLSKYCQREHYDSMDSLKDSIQRHGLFQFPAVTDDGEGFYRLIFGSRRYHAYKNSGEKTIPCRIIEANDEKAAILSFVENRERKDLNPVEEARKLKQINEEFNWTNAELGKRIGWPTSVIAERLTILRLDDHILNKVDTGFASSFKLTHALTLSKLVGKKRFSEKLEIEKLHEKTINHQLSSTELKALVLLIRNGDYDRLPDSLRMYLLNSRYMTSAMARLYLEPETVIPGEGKTSDRWREMSLKLGKEQLENLFIKAVKNEWPYKKTVEKLRDLVNHELRSNDGRRFRNDTNSQKLLHEISLLHDRLATDRSQILESAKSNPKQAETLCTTIEWLESKLKPFLISLKEALAENMSEKDAKDKE